MSEKVQVSIKEIYALQCPECRKRLEKLVMKKLQEKAVKTALQDEVKRGTE